MKVNGKLTIPDKEIADFCRRWNVARLSLFGSVLRDDFRPDSDIDVLVEFTDRSPGFGFFRMEDELTEMLGRKVDLNTPGFLSPRFRDRVVREAKLLYARS